MIGLKNSKPFRQKAQALAEVASTAARRGHAAENVRESSFAVVAFLDEAVLTASDTNAANWVGKHFAEELFEQRSAGEIFFQRLEALRANRDSQDLAEILEAYTSAYFSAMRANSQAALAASFCRLCQTCAIGSSASSAAILSSHRTGRFPMSLSPPQVVVDPFNRESRLFAIVSGTDWRRESESIISGCAVGALPEGRRRADFPLPNRDVCATVTLARLP